MDCTRQSAKGTIVCSLAALTLASIVGISLAHPVVVRAQDSRIFELRVYHVLPGKLPALESRFRDTTSKILARHGLHVIGYWTSDNADPAQASFIFMVAHNSREEAKQQWDAVWADPDFQKVVSAEKAEPLVQKVETTLMRPSDFSPLK